MKRIALGGALSLFAGTASALAQEGVVIEARPDAVFIDLRQMPMPQQGTRVGFVRVEAARREVGQGSVLAVWQGKAQVAPAGGEMPAAGDLVVTCPDPSQPDPYGSVRLMAVQARPGSPSAATAGQLQSALAARDAAVRQGACDLAAYDQQIASLSSQMQDQIRRAPAGRGTGKAPATKFDTAVNRATSSANNALDSAGSVVDSFGALKSRFGGSSQQPPAAVPPPPNTAAAPNTAPPAAPAYPNATSAPGGAWSGSTGQPVTNPAPGWGPPQNQAVPQQNGAPPAWGTAPPALGSPAASAAPGWGATQPVPSNAPASGAPGWGTTQPTPSNPQASGAPAWNTTASAPMQQATGPAPGGTTQVPAPSATQPTLAPTAAAAAADPAWDFVPGERVLFYEDFSDLAPGGAPQRWMVRGAPVDVKQAPGGKELLVTKPTTISATLGTLPANFTAESEFEFSEPTVKSARPRIRLQIGTTGSSSPIDVVLTLNWTPRTGTVTAYTSGHSLGNGQLKFDPAQRLSLNVWMQEQRLRVYANNERLVDANQVKTGTVNAAFLSFTDVPGPIGLARFRVAESAPDVAQAIQASGRYVTHGIHFDVDSDHLQPESFGVLKAIAAALQTRPDLQLRIEGHTDATGDASYNADLSRRRAEAVRAALVSQFGIDAARLTALGQGASTPLASNDTVDGRAQNRRVEFVKQ